MFKWFVFPSGGGKKNKQSKQLILSKGDIQERMLIQFMYSKARDIGVDLDSIPIEIMDKLKKDFMVEYRKTWGNNMEFQILPLRGIKAE